MPTLRPLLSRRGILRLHLVLALAAGAFLVVLGATGCVMAFEDELDRLLNPGLFKVQPGPAPLPVAAVQAALAKARPDGHFNGLRIPTAPDEAYQAQQRSLQVFIDGYRGTVIGTRATPTVLQRIHQLHTSLSMGAAGHVVVGCAAAALLLLVATGIHLWWPRKRLGVAFRAPARQVIMDLHQVLGIAAAAFLLVLGLSGVAISLGDAWAPWAHRLAGTAPPVRDAPSTPMPGAAAIGPDEAIRVARTALPGATPFAFTGPGSATGSYRVALRFPEDLTPGGRSWVVVDQYRGTALAVVSSRAPTAVTGLVTFNRAVHTGDVLGIPTKAVASLTSLVLVLQTLGGWYLWWRKPRLQR